MNKSQLCYYMNSVTKNTPILLKENENIKILRIDEIVDEEDWYVNEIICIFVWIILCILVLISIILISRKW